jgi:molybdopterin-biosynthesis enzyme MoeA-like protein
MAGVPKIFEAMLAAVLPGLRSGRPVLSRTVRVELPEGDIAGPLAGVARAHPGLSFGSYPFSDAGRYGANVVIRGTEEAALEGAEAALRTALGL